MTELKVSPEFQEQYGQLMLTVGNELKSLINAGDVVMLDQFIKSITFIMETVNNRIKEIKDDYTEAPTNATFQ
jgi:hypothetical protein